MNNIVNIVGLGHINIVVENIDEGIKFYEELLGAVPYQIFRNFSNAGFSKAAGFLENPEKINLHIAFLNIPESGLTLELMHYINPVSNNKVLYSSKCLSKRTVKSLTKSKNVSRGLFKRSTFF